MESETIERQLLVEAKKQTKALETMRIAAIVFLVVVGIGVVVWLIGAMSGAGILA